MSRIALLLGSFLLIACAAISFAGDAPEGSRQTIITMEKNPVEQAAQVVIYTMSTCPHCREAREYLASHNIPFIDRDVDTDDRHMATLMSIYDSMGVPELKRGVPLIVVGNRIRIQGFNRDKLQNALKEVAVKP